MTTELSCSRCKAIKPIEAFRIRRNRSQNGKRLGRWSWCRVCELESFKTPLRREQSNARTKKSRDHMRKTNLLEMRRKERASNLRKYGITVDDYDRMLKQQNGVCAICFNPPRTGRWPRLHVDHCHATGMIRGLLCNTCNTSLGAFKDDVTVIGNAINYLVRNAHSKELDMIYHPEIIGCFPAVTQPAGS